MRTQTLDVVRVAASREINDPLLGPGRVLRS